MANSSSSSMPAPHSASKMEMTLKRKFTSMTAIPDPQTAKGKGKATTTTPKTAPRKRKAPADKAAEAGEGDEEPVSNIIPKRKRAKASTKETSHATGEEAVNSMTIPNSYDDCGAADKMLLDNRDAGVGWSEIRKTWMEITGHKRVGVSTLPNRYARLKQNFVVIREEDNGHLITAKREVEKAHAEEKWGLIAQKVVELGGEEYEGETLRVQYRKLMESMGALPPDDVEASDFRD